MALNTPQQLRPIYTLCPHNFNSFRLQSIFRYNVSLWKNLPFENRTSHEKHLHSDLTKMEGKEEVYVNNMNGALKNILTKDVMMQLLYKTLS